MSSAFDTWSDKKHGAANGNILFGKYHHPVPSARAGQLALEMNLLTYLTFLSDYRSYLVKILLPDGLPPFIAVSLLSFPVFSWALETK